MCDAAWGGHETRYRHWVLKKPGNMGATVSVNQTYGAKMMLSAVNSDALRLLWVTY